MITFSITPVATASVSSANLPTVVLSGVITDTALTYVTATINWGDDTTQVFTQQVKPIVMAATHVYKTPGTFIITVTASNFSAPTPQTITWTGSAVFANPGYQPTANVQTHSNIGPIMANAVGYPNASNWDWQFGTDNACLISSLTLLLSTARGERLMDPNFGTNLRQLIFSLSGPIVNDAIHSDVQQAVASYEPRASLVDLQTTQTGRVITVNAAFQSLINGQQITIQNLAISS